MKRRVFAALLAATMVASMLAGCQKSTGEGGEKDKVPNLKFYISGTPIAEQERVMEKANKIIEEKIGVTVDIIPVADYDQKMNMMINSGDDWDLCFAASWGGMNYFENAAAGAYADLTDLLKDTETYKRIPESLWDGVKVDGKIYMTVNYQQWGVAARKGLQLRSDIAEEVGFDPKELKGKNMLDAMKLLGDKYLGPALEKHPEMIGWETSAGYNVFANDPIYWDMDAVGDVAIPGWVYLTDDNEIKDNKVINQFETQEFKDFCYLMRDWYNKKYVREDGATLQDTTPDRKAAKELAMHYFGWPDSYDFPENAPNIAMSMCTVDTAPSIGVSTSRTLIPSTAASTAGVAVNANSDYIEEAVKLIELLNTDDELYMLITQGEEGVDYVYDEDGNYSLVEGKYDFHYNEWQVGQSYSPDFTRAMYNKNESGDIAKESQKKVFEADETADASPLSGFAFNAEPVKTEIANCAAVITEYVPGFGNGSRDVDKDLPAFLEALKTAGVDKIIEEKQAQLDAWRK